MHDGRKVERNSPPTRIMERVVEVFGDRDVAMAWMNTPNRAMEGCTPLLLIENDPGIEMVERILGRIEHGLFS